MVTTAELFDDAKEIFQRDSPLPQARVRTIISRAFFAAYNHCLQRAGSDFVFDKGKRGSKATQLIMFLSTEQQAAAIQKIGRRLRGLEGQRIMADFILNISIERHAANNAIVDASTILSAWPDVIEAAENQVTA